MKRNVLALFARVALWPIVARADDLPKRPGFSRYQEMLNKSPFAVATAIAPPPSTPNFAKDLYIANAARLAGEGVVTLTSSTDKNMKEYLSTKAPNSHGYSVSNIEWSDRVGETKVTISKDGQFATLTFNQALLAQSAPSLPPQPQPQQFTPPVPAGTPFVNTIRPAPIPMLPTPPTHVRGVIQRNPEVPAQQRAVQESQDQ